MRRPKVEDGYWHVYSRGVRRLDLFQDSEDRTVFIRLLAAALAATKCILHAFALMDNHYHLVLRASTEALSRCMQYLNWNYSIHYNRKYKKEGHAFDKPFQSCLQKSPYLLFKTVGYVLLNPVAAGLLPSPRLCRWTSFGSYAGGYSPLPADPSPVFQYLDEDPQVARRLFLDYLSEQACLPRIPAAPTRSQLARQQFEWLQDYARKHREQFLDVSPTLVAMYWGRQCGIPPKVMAQVLDTKPRAITNQLHHLKTVMKKDPELREDLQMP